MITVVMDYTHADDDDDSYSDADSDYDSDALPHSPLEVEVFLNHTLGGGGRPILS